MSNVSNETARIISAETQEQLKQACNTELTKIMKLRLVQAQLKLLRFKKQKDGDEQIQHALKALSINDYLKLGDKDEDWLLDLGHLRTTINLSYIERKTVRQQLTEIMNKNLRPIVEFSHKINKEHPGIFKVANSNSPTKTSTNSLNSSNPFCDNNNQISPVHKKILLLEERRRKNIIKLTEMRNRKCAYMKAAAELKTGPYLSNELEILDAQARMNQIKTNVLRDYFVNELVTRTQHSLKALKEVEGYINDEVEKLEE